MHEDDALYAQFEPLESAPGNAWKCKWCGECVWGESEMDAANLMEHLAERHPISSSTPFNPPRRVI
jgi:hypothetical protein